MIFHETSIYTRFLWVLILSGAHSLQAQGSDDEKTDDFEFRFHSEVSPEMEKSLITGLNEQEDFMFVSELAEDSDEDSKTEPEEATNPVIRVSTDSLIDFHNGLSKEVALFVNALASIYRVRLGTVRSNAFYRGELNQVLAGIRKTPSRLLRVVEAMEDSVRDTLEALLNNEDPEADLEDPAVEVHFPIMAQLRNLYLLVRSIGLENVQNGAEITWMQWEQFLATNVAERWQEIQRNIVYMYNAGNQILAILQQIEPTLHEIMAIQNEQEDTESEEEDTVDDVANFLRGLAIINDNDDFLAQDWADEDSEADSEDSTTTASRVSEDSLIALYNGLPEQVTFFLQRLAAINRVTLESAQNNPADRGALNQIFSDLRDAPAWLQRVVGAMEERVRLTVAAHLNLEDSGANLDDLEVGVNFPVIDQLRTLDLLVQLLEGEDSENGTGIAWMQWGHFLATNAAERWQAIHHNVVYMHDTATQILLILQQIEPALYEVMAIQNGQKDAGTEDERDEDVETEDEYFSDDSDSNTDIIMIESPVQHNTTRDGVENNANNVQVNFSFERQILNHGSHLMR